MPYTRLPSSALRVTGADRLDFVQGQMTGNVKAAPTPGLVEGCFLNVRGQIEQVARVYRRADDLYLHLDAGQAEPLAARLRRYIIFDQVELQDVSSTLATVHLWNEALSGWDPRGPDAQSFELGGGTVLVGRINRTGTPGLDLHYLQAHETAVLAALDGEERPLEALEAARIEAGLPDVVQDRWQGFLPQEVGLERAVAVRKGCYVGQEIMARLEARGATRYQLTRLSGEDLPPYTDVTVDGRVVGRTGASTGAHTLARLRKDLDPGQPLLVGQRPATFLPDAQPAS
ncbi:folate-binding protein [Deinococcus sonorensis]|uniref:Folate-binding protein n=2 Tax=Deinococcus sonorensis TaxID=309891 RepID=A0AAU7UCS3_9DEIO